jgi:hypothetical protein
MSADSDRFRNQNKEHLAMERTDRVKGRTAHYEMNCPVNFDASFDVSDRVTPKRPREGDTYHLAFVLSDGDQETHEVVLARTLEDTDTLAMITLRDVGELRSGVPSRPGARYDVWGRDFLFMLSLYGLTRESYLALVEECLALLESPKSEQTPPDAA